MTSTPWGTSDYSKSYTRGIVFYGTPGHGGFRVSRTMNERIPDCLRQATARGDGWYEEDCEWAKIAIAFPQFFTKPGELDQAKLTLARYFPDAYEAFYGVELKPGESYEKDRRRFEKENFDRFVIRSCSGSWAKGVPEGMIGSYARRQSDGMEVSVLVSEDYHRSGKDRIAHPPMPLWEGADA
jgi:hypothetical protein